MIYLAISLVVYSFLVCFYAMKYIVGRPPAIIIMIVMLAVHHLLIIEGMGRSKPIDVEFRDLIGKELIAYSAVGDSEIHVWIDVNGEPVAYVLDYSPGLLADIANATERAGRNGRAVVGPRDSYGIDEEDFTFHAPPPPPVEPKNAGP